MFCTVCEVEVKDTTHYNSSMHSLNSKRKLIGYPPLTTEELDTMSDTSSIETKKSFKRTQTITKQEKAELNKKCAFCNEVESSVHYRDHGLSDDQIYCVTNKQCFVCFEKFCSTIDLLQHLEEDVHRKAVSDGVSLFLDNGRILNPATTLIPTKAVVKKEDVDKIAPKANKITEQIQDDKRLNDVKVSVEMNGRWGKWMH